MGRLFKAFVFKLTKDVTFRVTLIIGAAVAVFMTLLYLLLNGAMQEALKEMYGEDADTSQMSVLSGQGMLLTSFSPVQNFGLAIPVTLIVYTTLEFSQGSIRNKIIAGHSKFKIYVSLCINGLIYAFALLFTYVGVCTGLGSIFGGFDPYGFAYIGLSGAMVTPEFIIKFFVTAVLTYVSIVSFTIFIVTVFRSVGPCIPLVLILLMGCYYIPALSTALASVFTEMGEEGAGLSTIFTLLDNTLKFLDPLYGISVVPIKDAKAYMDTLTLVGGIVSNLGYAAIFFFAGSALFRKRDIK